MSDRRYTIAVDFDGVLHSYSSAWVDHHVIPDPPVDGAIDWLNEMSKRFKIAIHTTRAKTPEGVAAVREWLREHGFHSNVEGVEITAVKPPALVYIDDRAWRFVGRFPSAQEIHDARPWNKAKAPA